MSYTATFTENVTVDGQTVSNTEVVTSDNRTGSSPTSVPAAKAGTLAVHTSTSVGTLTMASGHGFNTGDIIDLYWSGGSRHGVICGTVATNSVPITGGTGDDLPIATTVIAAMERYVENVGCNGDDISAIIIKSAVPSIVTLLESDGTTVIATFVLTADDSPSPKYVYSWNASKGANPVAGGAIAKCAMTHGQLSVQTGFDTKLFYN